MISHKIIFANNIYKFGKIKWLIFNILLSFYRQKHRSKSPWIPFVFIFLLWHLTMLYRRIQNKNILWYLWTESRWKNEYSIDFFLLYRLASPRLVEQQKYPYRCELSVLWAFLLLKRFRRFLSPRSTFLLVLPFSSRPPLFEFFRRDQSWRKSIIPNEMY